MAKKKVFRWLIGVLGTTILAALIVFAAYTLLGNRERSSMAAVAKTATAKKVNKITEENQRPGTTNWKSPNFDHYGDIDDHDTTGTPSFADSGGSGEKFQTGWVDTATIEGYASKTSIDHGEAIDFYVSTSLPSYTINVYRMGWYGGTGGRLITTIAGLPGQNYGVPAPDPSTGLITATWPIAYTLQTTSDWVTGVYLAYLNASDGSVNYIIFVVRDDEHPADILFPIPIATYQAYNGWGGKSLYDYNSPSGRAYKVSYDRPFDHDDGSGLFFEGDYNMIRWLESQNYNISYATSIDLDLNANLLSNYKMFLTDYHDEYYSKDMRDHVTAARDQGKSLAFFTSNSVYWQIRYESLNGQPDRVEVCYKDPALDPMSTSSTPWLTTTTWRSDPVDQPENALLGVMYESLFSQSITYPFVVANSSQWIYEGTGFSDGDSISQVIGYEYDKVWDNGFTPANLVVLSNSPIAATNSVANATIYTAASGAIVFNASTMYWGKLLDNNRSSLPQDVNIKLMTTNLLARMLSPNTPPPTPTTAPTGTPPPNGGTFYRAINVNGSPVIIDGNHWDSGTAKNFTASGWNFCLPSVPLIPATDPVRAAMIHCSIFGPAATLTMSAIPTGTYNVYLYTWEDNAPESFNISLNGQVVAPSYNSGPAGTWARLGPWPVTITGGTITISTSGGYGNLSGLEVWSIDPNSVTSVPTSTLTNTPTRTPTSVATKPLSGAPGPGSAFYRAINLGGSALTIDGNAWEGDTAPNFTTSGTSPACNPWATLVPATDANRTAMIQCTRSGWATTLTMSAVPNGSYSVYLYEVETWQARVYSVSLQGQVVLPNFSSGTAGTWNKLGPWTANVTDGTLTLNTNGSTASLSGLEVWSIGSNTPTSTLTNTAVSAPTSTLTNTATNTATDAATSTPTDLPTNTPTDVSPGGPADVPTSTPTSLPTDTPTDVSTSASTDLLTNTPTDVPTDLPTSTPTDVPTDLPTSTPTTVPTNTPTDVPTDLPTNTPTDVPTDLPTSTPTTVPTNTPTDVPTDLPTSTPTTVPTNTPTDVPTDLPTSTPTTVPTNTPTDVPTNTPTTVPTNTPTNTPTSAPTNTPTTVPTNTPTSAPTNTPTTVPTRTLTSTPTSTPGSGGTFYRAIDLAGSAITIDGHAWEADSAPNFTTTGSTAKASPWMVISPTTDAARTTMIQSYRIGFQTTYVMSNVPTGSYTVYVYEVETFGPRIYSISLQGQVVLANFNSGVAGTWHKFGPWTTSVTNGTLTLVTTGQSADMCGLEVWSNASGLAPTFQP